MPSPGDARRYGGEDAPRMTRWERLKYTFVEPSAAGGREAPVDERTADELREALHRADDRERAVGLIAAPVATAISFGIITALIDRDHTPGAKVVASVSTLHELLLVLLGLSVLMLVTALWRKRLFLGIVLAVYGVSLFQLGWLGFAVPFVLAGAWYIVRQFRMQSALRRADETEADVAPSNRRSAAKPVNGARPRPSKRYTPPT